MAVWGWTIHLFPVPFAWLRSFIICEVGQRTGPKRLGRRSPGLAVAISACCKSHDSGTCLQPSYGMSKPKRYTKKEGMAASRGAPSS